MLRRSRLGVVSFSWFHPLVAAKPPVSVVLVFVDMVAAAILLAVQAFLLRGGQVAVVLGQVVAFLFLKAISTPL